MFVDAFLRTHMVHMQRANTEAIRFNFSLKGMKIQNGSYARDRETSEPLMIDRLPHALHQIGVRLYGSNTRLPKQQILAWRMVRISAISIYK